MASNLGASVAGLKPLIGGLLDIVFPPQALDAASTATPQSPGLTAQAWSRITFLEEPVCNGCGVAFEYDQGGDCAACLGQPRAFSRARAACVYDEASRDLILQFKHADRTDLAPLFTDWISRAGARLLAEADVIAPVPLHRHRLFRRRYNQSAEIARPLARRHGLRYLPDALQRARATESQGGKSGSGRRRNVSGAFAVRSAAASLVEGKRIVLIDDVMTTGATAEACARALLKVGAASVDLCVIARVQEAANLTT